MIRRCIVTKTLKALALAAGLAVTAHAANAAVVFSDGATDFNGTYRGVGTFTATFFAPAGSSGISFDLFGARSVDGLNDYQDVFTVAVNGVDVFSGSFDMSGGGGNSVLTNTLGWTSTTATVKTS
jgi:hypothetical protein